MNELNIYICQFCKKEYQSDGLRKPKSFRKDGSAYQYYDSTIFCSKECCNKNQREKQNKYWKNHPETKQKAIRKFLQTWNSKPLNERREIIECRVRKSKQTWNEKTLEDKQLINQKRIATFKQTLQDNPEIMMNAMNKRKQTYINHPEIVQKAVEKRKQTYKDHPDIQERATLRFKQTIQNNPEILRQKSEMLRNHPEIIQKAVEKRKQTLQNNPKINIDAANKRRQTYIDHPELRQKSVQNRARTLQNNPEIIEKQQNKAYQTMKERGFISKSEQQMIQLLKDKYGEENVVEQYRDNRYMKPNSNYHYACDCYIKSLDLFIEYNGSRFHPTEEDRGRLEQEIEKFKLRYPDKSIKQCQAFTLLRTIENDKIKQQVAKDNKLNYIVCNEENNLKELYDNKIL